MPLAGRLDGDLRTDWHAVWSTPTLCLGQRWHPWHTQYAKGGWLLAILPLDLGQDGIAVSGPLLRSAAARCPAA